MRTRLSLALFAILPLASVAQAQQVISPYEESPAANPPQPLNPYAAYPAPQVGYPTPPAYRYGESQASPLIPTTPPPSYQRGYYLYPVSQYSSGSGYYAPVGSCCSVQPSYSSCSSCASSITNGPEHLERIRRFSLGVHGTVLALNQSVGNSNVVLGGAGLQLRIRSKGRFGLELNQSFLHAEYWSGEFQRTSFPFAFSLMFYVFPNKEERHFNLYGLAGFGAMYDSIKLRDENRDLVTQNFLEWQGHVGLGLELRYSWFAIAADARMVGLLRDGHSTPSTYYGGVPGGPVPDKSYGIMGNAYISFWF